VTLYPLIVEPREVELIWGGHALVRRFGKSGNPNAPIGESWECWDDNRVANGAYAGRTIGALRTELSAQLLGPLDPARIFPLLTKFIDAQRALSVQVHPGDAYAQRVEAQPNGKTECWYVLEAAPGATIVLGWTRDTSRGEYLERVKEGSLDELLRHIPVRPGDAFYLPAGTLHAIGAGIILYETQQASDLTYRIFDYNRLGPDGKPRPLHVDKAADVLDYRRCDAGPLQGLNYDLDGARRTALVADPRFVLELVEVDGAACGIDLEGLPLIVTALEQPLELEALGTIAALRPYQTAVVPAGFEVVMVRGLEGRARMLTSAPPADPDALPRRFARAAVGVNRSTDFLAQFSPA
jgi:mannose-6-phosphate isomerase